jgi:hypothetical protein
VLGKSALSPDAAVDIPILLIAAGVHFSLSILFAALLAPAAGHWRPAASLAVGVSFGVLLYVVNLHILTALFPLVRRRAWRDHPGGARRLRRYGDDHPADAAARIQLNPLAVPRHSPTGLQPVRTN